VQDAALFKWERGDGELIAWCVSVMGSVWIKLVFCLQWGRGDREMDERRTFGPCDDALRRMERLRSQPWRAISGPSIFRMPCPLMKCLFDSTSYIILLTDLRSLWCEELLANDIAKRLEVSQESTWNASVVHVFD
jgi:hypothetical protein